MGGWTINKKGSRSDECSKPFVYTAMAVAFPRFRSLLFVPGNKVRKLRGPRILFAPLARLICSHCAHFVRRPTC
jgi:hypothetical protein